MAHGDRASSSTLQDVPLLRETEAARLLEVQNAQARKVYGRHRFKGCLRKTALEVRR